MCSTLCSPQLKKDSNMTSISRYTPPSHTNQQRTGALTYQGQTIDKLATLELDKFEQALEEYTTTRFQGQGIKELIERVNMSPDECKKKGLAQLNLEFVRTVDNAFWANHKSVTIDGVETYGQFRPIKEFPQQADTINYDSLFGRVPSKD